MNYMEKLYDKSAEEIVNDLLDKHDGNAAEALAFTNNLLQKSDGLTLPTDFKRNLLKSRDLLSLRNASESKSQFEAAARLAKAEIALNEGWKDWFSKNKPMSIDVDEIDLDEPVLSPEEIKTGLTYTVFLPFKNQPLEITIPNVSSYSDPRAVKVREELRKKHPHSTITASFANHKYTRKFEEASKDWQKPTDRAAPDSYVDDERDAANIQEMLYYALHNIHPAMDYDKPLWVDNTTAGRERVIVLDGIDIKNQQKGKPASDEDYVYIREVSYVQSNKTGGWVKKFGDLEAIPVSTFKSIINNDINASTFTKFKNKYPEEGGDLVQSILDADKNRKSKYQKWEDKYKDELNLDRFDKPTKGKIYRDIEKRGYSPEDVEIRYAFNNWKQNNKGILSKVEKGISVTNDENLWDAYKTEQQRWFKNDITDTELIKTATNWYIQNIKPTVDELKTKKKESSEEDLKEFRPRYKDYNAAMPIKDPYQIKSTLKQLGIDPIFMSLPIIQEFPYNTAKYKSAAEDPDAEAPKEFIIVDFPDEHDLNRINVRNYEGGRKYEMSADEIKRIIAENPKNADPKPNTVRIASNPYLANKTLNPAAGGTYITIPEGVILKMLDFMQTNYPIEYPNVVDKYKAQVSYETRNPLVLKALKAYNTDKSTTIRAFSDPNSPNGIVYKGFKPYEMTNRPPKHGNEDPYKQLMKYK